MSFDDLHARGRDTFGSLIPDGAERLDRIFPIAPALAEMAVGTVYGHLHHRPALDPRLREAAALAAIVASGMHGTPLAVHTRTAMATGLAPSEIVEVVLEAAAFSGLPRAVSSLPTIEEAFEAAGVSVPPPRTPREVVLADFAADTEVSVLTLAPDQALVIIEGDDENGGHPGAIFHVQVDDGRIRAVTRFTAGKQLPSTEP